MQNTPCFKAANSSPPTLLDPIETTVEFRSLLNHPFESIHAAHRKIREDLIVTLATSNEQRLIRRAKSIAHCCAFPSMRRTYEGEASLSLMRCRDRFCPLCAKVVARKTAKRVEEVIRPWDQCRHLTLTLAATDAPLGQQIDKLLKSFRRLRQRSFWKRGVQSGIGTVEVTYNHGTDRWHPHLHLLLNGAYLPHDLISKEWKAATGDSFVVHITAVHSKADAGRYVAKYVTKPSVMGSIPPHRLVELALAMSGRRQVITFGKAHNTGLPVSDPPPPKKGVRYLLSVHAIIRAYRARKSFALELMGIARQRLPALERLVAEKDGSPPAHHPQGDLAYSGDLNLLLDQVKWWDDYGTDPPGHQDTLHGDHEDMQMRLFGDR